MGKFTRTTTIDATPQQVFATLADLGQAKQWMPAIHAIDRVGGEGELAVGSTWIETRKTKRGLQVSRIEVTELTPGQAFAIKVTGKQFGSALRFNLAPAGAGTEVTYTCDASGKGLAALFSGRITKEAEAESEPMLASLKSHVEAAAKPLVRISEKATKAAKGTAAKASATTKATKATKTAKGAKSSPTVKAKAK